MNISNSINKKISVGKWELNLIVILLAVGILLGLFIVFLNVIQRSSAAAQTWTQTDWSGGVATENVTGTVNTYSSSTNINSSVTGQLTISQRSNWYHLSWNYRKPITIDETKIAGLTALTNFPVLINTTSNDLKSVANGGKVAQDDGGDIVFTLSNGTTKLDHDIESYNATTGAVIAWVEIPSLSAITNTALYIYYGNGSGVADQWNTNGTWNFNYMGVWHLKENPASSAPQIKDSTSNASNGTSGGAMTLSDQVTGQINGALDLDGDDFINGVGGVGTYSYIQNTGVFSLSSWVKFRDHTAAGETSIMSTAGTTSEKGFLLYYNPSGKKFLFQIYRGVGATTAANVTSVDNAITDNNWHYVTVTGDGANISLYIDGNPLGIALGGPIADFPTGNSARALEFGRYSAGVSSFGYLNGNFDEKRISNIALSAEWINAEFNNQSNPSTFYSIGTEEGIYNTSGNLESQIFNGNLPRNWLTLDYSLSGTGTVAVKVRTSNSSTMVGADDFTTCSAIGDLTEMNLNECVTDGDRYVQYQISLTSADEATTPIFQDISIEYDLNDLTAPPVNATDLQITGVSDGSWTNTEPVITWTEGTDDGGGTGLLGYCVSLDEATIGTSSLLNPVTSAGKLAGIDDEIAETYCPFIATETSLNLSLLSGLTLTSNKQYYFSIKAVDISGNIWSGSGEDYQDLVSFKYDDVLPTNPAFISMPSNFISTKDATITWPTSGGNQAADSHSGLAGLQYRIGNEGIWYGDTHNGNQNLTDLLVNDGAYTTDPTVDYPNLNDGTNIIYVRTWDTAGNVTVSYVSGALKINTTAPSSPENLIITPSSNTTNSYAFDWDPPVSFTGDENLITYCYTINTLPTSITCNFTAEGVTSLSADSYATQPGSNTFYVVAKDEASNINYDTYTQGTFTYTGSAPGIPANVDVSDISTKETSDWKLAVTWAAPSNVGAGIESYRVYRTTTNTSCSSNFGDFTQVSTVSGTSHIDTGLTQQPYFYCIRACDSANNCSAVSATVNETPTGNFTEPAVLVSGPTVNSVSTRKAVISWATDRNSDSRIEFGTESQVYNDQEVGNSAQLTAHTVTLSNLNPGITYYYRAKWTDEDGNTGLSAEKNFTTQSAPTISDVAITSIGIDSVLIKFTSLNSAKAKIYFGKTTNFGGLQEVSTALVESDYSSLIQNLDDGTKYFYKINPVDTDGFEYEGTILDFATLPRPTISNVQIEEVKNTPQPTVRVTWNSNTPITSIASFYPANDATLVRDEINIELNTEHAVELIGLIPTTTYKLTVRGIDRIGNEAVSQVYEFTTATDSRPPRIFNIKIDSVLASTSSDEENNAQFILSWDTDELATSQIEFGKGSSGTYSSATLVDKDLSNKHVVIISNLTPSEVYHLKIVSEDIAKNEAVSDNIVAITIQDNSSALDLVLKGLSDIFSFLR